MDRFSLRLTIVQNTNRCLSRFTSIIHCLFPFKPSVSLYPHGTSISEKHFHEGHPITKEAITSIFYHSLMLSSNRIIESRNQIYHMQQHCLFTTDIFNYCRQECMYPWGLPLTWILHFCVDVKDGFFFSSRVSVYIFTCNSVFSIYARLDRLRVYNGWDAGLRGYLLCQTAYTPGLSEIYWVECL